MKGARICMRGWCIVDLSAGYHDRLGMFNTHTGRYATRFLDADWTSEECTRAGFWLLTAAIDQGYFQLSGADDQNEDARVVTIHPDWTDEIERLREEIT